MVLATSGYLADSSFFGGWPSAFYLYGKYFLFEELFVCIIVQQVSNTKMLLDEDIIR